MAGFKTGFAVGALCVTAGTAWLLIKLDSLPLVFPSKMVYQSGDYASVEGSIVGDEKEKKQRPINNMVKMTCHKQEVSCQFLQVDQISSNQIGTIFDDTLTVRKWDTDELLADSLDLSSAFQGCMYYEVRLLFKSEDVTYTRLPNPKADKVKCKEFMGTSKQLRTWRIDDGEAMRHDS